MRVRLIDDIIFVSGIYWYEYVFNPIRKRYLKWKYRKQAREVQRKYLSK